MANPSKRSDLLASLIAIDLAIPDTIYAPLMRTDEVQGILVGHRAIEGISTALTHAVSP